MQITAIIHDPEHNLLRLLTAGDLEGWSPGVSAPVAQTIFDLFEPILVGGSVWEREQLRQRCREAGRLAGLTPASLASVDVALWDLFAKAQNLPLFRAIGGFRDRLPAVRQGKRQASARDHIEAAVAARDAGLFGYCLCATHEADLVDALPDLRAAVGDRFRLLYDGGQQFELEQALAVGRALEQIDGHWFAEPLGDGDVSGLQKLADALTIPVVAGAFMGDSIQAATRALTSRAVDRVRVTIPLNIGITGALKLARGAEALQMNCEIDWARSAGPYAAAHLLGAVRNAEFYTADGTFDGADGFQPLSVIDGELLLPQEPGLGLQLIDPTHLTQSTS